MSCLGEDIMMPILREIIEESVKKEDWKFRHAAFMVIAQVGEYLEDISLLGFLIPILLVNLKHDHPRIRHASLYCIGILSDDLAPEFQQKFHPQIVPALTQMLTDPIPRVLSHVCAALTNFFEHLNSSISLPLIPSLLPRLICFVKEEISIVKENALTCISALAESSGSNFVEYSTPVITFLFDLIEKVNSMRLKRLRGQAIECLSIISSSICKDNFKNYLEKFINIMIYLQENVGEKEDPQRYYILSAWQRLVLTLGQDFIPYLDKMFPSFLKLAQSEPEIKSTNEIVKESLQSLLKDAAKKKKTFNMNTSETEEKEIAIETINSFAVELKELFLPYVSQSSNVVIECLRYLPNSDIRKSAAKCITSLMYVVKKSDIPSEHKINCSKNFLMRLNEALDKEDYTDVKSQFLLAMRKIMKIIGPVFNENESKDFLLKIWGLIIQSKKKQKEIEDENTEESGEE